MTLSEAKEFVNSLSAKTIAKTKTILAKYGFHNVEMTFSATVRDNQYFKILFLCGDYVYEVPEMDILETFSIDNTLDNVEAFLESYGTFVAYEYLNRRGIEMELSDVYKSSNDTGS
jgi:hypothetical protein